jgi:hypothetical protein
LRLRDQLYVCAITENHDLTAVDGGAISTPPDFTFKGFHAKNAFHIPPLTPDNTTIVQTWH